MACCAGTAVMVEVVAVASDGPNGLRAEGLVDEPKQRGEQPGYSGLTLPPPHLSPAQCPVRLLSRCVPAVCCLPTSDQCVAQTFLSQDAFAVVGASPDQGKFGNKLIRWYLQRRLPVTPINPKASEIEGLVVSHDLRALPPPGPNKTAISIVTPPAVSLATARLALLELDVPAIWLQPGAEDPAFVSWARSLSPELQDRIIYGGPCVLRDADALLASYQNKL